MVAQLLIEKTPISRNEIISLLSNPEECKIVIEAIRENKLSEDPMIKARYHVIQNMYAFVLSHIHAGESTRIQLYTVAAEALPRNFGSRFNRTIVSTLQSMETEALEENEKIKEKNPEGFATYTILSCEDRQEFKF